MYAQIRKQALSLSTYSHTLTISVLTVLIKLFYLVLISFLTVFFSLYVVLVFDYFLVFICFSFRFILLFCFSFIF